MVVVAVVVGGGEGRGGSSPTGRTKGATPAFVLEAACCLSQPQHALGCFSLLLPAGRPAAAEECVFLQNPSCPTLPVDSLPRLPCHAMPWSYPCPLFGFPSFGPTSRSPLSLAQPSPTERPLSLRAALREKERQSPPSLVGFCFHPISSAVQPAPPCLTLPNRTPPQHRVPCAPETHPPLSPQSSTNSGLSTSLSVSLDTNPNYREKERRALLPHSALAAPLLLFRCFALLLLV